MLKALIDESIYVVDEFAVAEAVLARASVRASVAEPAVRSDQARPVPTRSAVSGGAVAPGLAPHPGPRTHGLIRSGQ